MGEGPHFVFCGHIIWQDMEVCKKIADSKGLSPLAGSGAEPRLNCYKWHARRIGVANRRAAQAYRAAGPIAARHYTNMNIKLNWPDKNFARLLPFLRSNDAFALHLLNNSGSAIETDIESALQERSRCLTRFGNDSDSLIV